MSPPARRAAGSWAGTSRLPPAPWRSPRNRAVGSAAGSVFRFLLGFGNAGLIAVAYYSVNALFATHVQKDLQLSGDQGQGPGPGPGRRLNREDFFRASPRAPVTPGPRRRRG